MALVDFPADTFLSVYVIEASNPPRELAFYRLRHRDDDPTAKVALIEDGSRTSGMDERALRHLLTIGVPLATACDTDGNLVQGNKMRRGFDLSLARWLRDPRTLRLVALTQTAMRFGEFTPEQHHLWAEAMQRLDERAQELRSEMEDRN